MAASNIQNKMYGNAYFDRRLEEGRRAAEAIVPLLVDLARPQSVVDVGCGSGSWLEAFMNRGLKDLIGVDGDYVDRSSLPFGPERFIAADLFHPLAFDRSFSLALCLEVGEHLPDHRAAGLVKDLTRLAPVVAFSAAIPHQGGTGHVNEQWPSYWASLFAAEKFAAFDCIRPQVWEAKIPFWYA